MLIHTSIRTSDIERSIDFYTRVLGLKLLRRHEIKQNNAEIAFLQDSERAGSKLELTYYRDQKKFNQAEYEDRLFDHLAFQIKNLEETISMIGGWDSFVCLAMHRAQTLFLPTSVPAKLICPSCGQRYS